LSSDFFSLLGFSLILKIIWVWPFIINQPLFCLPSIFSHCSPKIIGWSFLLVFQLQPLLYLTSSFCFLSFCKSFICFLFSHSILIFDIDIYFFNLILILLIFFLCYFFKIFIGFQFYPSIQVDVFCFPVWYSLFFLFFR
jgi:hypothetical protein